MHRNRMFVSYRCFIVLKFKSFSNRYDTLDQEQLFASHLVRDAALCGIKKKSERKQFIYKKCIGYADVGTSGTKKKGQVNKKKVQEGGWWWWWKCSSHVSEGWVGGRL